MESTKSDWNPEIITVGETTKHPNADTLSIVQVHGYPVIIRTGDFVEGQKALYVPVDSVVPLTDQRFAWLGEGHERIRAKRLRGVFSMGMLVTADSPEIADPEHAAEIAGIKKYVSPQELALELGLKTPSGAPRPSAVNTPWFPVYGVDSLRRHPDVFRPGEWVVVTEKIHGTNARYTIRNGRFYVGSHKVLRGFKKPRWPEALDRLYLKARRVLGLGGRTHIYESHGDVWWEIAEKYQLREKLEHLNRTYDTEFVLYGEIYGEGIQDLAYDSPKGRKFVAFDLYDTKTGQFVDFFAMQARCERREIPVVPVIEDVHAWDAEAVKELAEGKTILGNGVHMREGVVVRPLFEKWHPNVGRVCMKYVSEQYLLRKAA